MLINHRFHQFVRSNFSGAPHVFDRQKNLAERDRAQEWADDLDTGLASSA
jgi:hypothetical protein